MHEDLRGAMARIVGEENVSDRFVDRLCYSRDCGPDPAGIPAIVVRPGSTEEVSSVLRWANERGHAVYTRGRATTFLGSGVKDGVILLEMTRLNRIERIDIRAGYVDVQAGAIWHGIDADLRRVGWELGVPGGGGLFSCTIGGTVAVNAIPHGATEYGMTGDHVLALEVVLANGDVVRTGSWANPRSEPIERNANGPDFAGLFIGSYGILGVITRVVYRIRRAPETELFRFAAYDDYRDLIAAAAGIQGRGAATFLVGLFGGPKPQGEDGDAFLHLIVRDRDATARVRMAEAEAIAESHGGRARPAEGTRHYWQEHMYSWLRNTGPSAYYSDRPFFCPEVAGFVSTPGLADAVALFRTMKGEREAEFAQFGIRVKGVDAYFARNGAYLWIDTLYDERRKDAWEYGMRLRGEVAERMFTEGRMSPGGLGAGISPVIFPKLGTTYELLRSTKRMLDPKGILNPGLFVEEGAR